MFSIKTNRKRGAVLTEALISMFILGTLFVSIATAITVSISNTKRLQEVNETSAYAQKVVDGFYAVAQSDSELFFKEIAKIEKNHFNLCKASGNFDTPCEINFKNISATLEEDDPNTFTLYDLMALSTEDPNNIATNGEMSEYDVKIYLLPSYKTSDAPGAKSVNYILSYNTFMLSSEMDGRIFNVSEFKEIYTFKIVVSKTIVEHSIGAVDFTEASPASITYIFQISSNGGARDVP